MNTAYSIMARWEIKLGRKKSDITLCNWVTLNGDYISQEAAREAAQEYLPYVKIIKKTWEIVEEFDETKVPKC